MQRTGILGLSLLSLQLFAGGIIQSDTPGWQLSGGLGMYLNEQRLKDSHLVISSIETDSLVEERQKHFPLFNLSLMKTVQPIGQLKQLLIGPSIYYRQVDSSGSVLQFMLPVFNNYSYQFKGDVVDGMIEAQAILNPFYKQASLFILAGLGASFASVEYHEVARDGIPAGTAYHSSKNSNYNFAADAGVGVIVPINNNWTVSIRYLYQYRGEADISGNSMNPSLATGLSAHLNTQNALLSISRNLA